MITDITGKMIQEGILVSGTNRVDLKNVEDGVYFLKTENEEFHLFKKK